jgi:hypothetical protein
VEQAFPVVEIDTVGAKLVVNSPIEPAGIRANTPLEDRHSVPRIVLSGKRIHHASEGAAQ